MRNRRRALGADERAAAARTLPERFADLPEYHQANHIAVYLAVDGEMDASQIVLHAREAGKQLYLPVLTSDSGDALEFAEWRPETVLQPNRFNIPEPHPQQRKLREPADLDLVLAPLVAFDAHGHRLGMGGGYYDRSFAFLKSGSSQQPCLIGLAYEFQRIDLLAAEPWDIPLAAVVTELRIYRFGSEKNGSTG